MKENLFYYVTTIVIIAIIAVCFTVFSQKDDCIVDFLNSYGYEVTKKPIEVVKIKIPAPLDMVYEEYNKLQLAAGFDLHLHEGKSGTRYTYEVTNYHTGETGVRANILVIDGEIAGGDICTLRIDGFMHELRENK